MTTPGSAGFQPASNAPSASHTPTPPKGVGVAPKSTLFGWYSRGYLPHFDEPGRVQAVTFRLADSLPPEVLTRLEAELLALPLAHRDLERRRLLEAALDRGLGACALSRPDIAPIAEGALRYFDGERYRLLAWCIMPNHVHALIEPLGHHSLASIIHSWKSFTARAANPLLGQSGALWQRDYHDRFIRDSQHLAAALRYIEENPVAAGLVANAADWPWSSASWERRLSAGISDLNPLKPAG